MLALLPGLASGEQTIVDPHAGRLKELGRIFVFREKREFSDTQTPIFELTFERTADRPIFSHRSLYGEEITAEGKVEIADPQRCDRLDPWLAGGFFRSEKACMFFVSRHVFDTTKRGSKAKFIIDSAERRDEYVTVEAESVGYENFVLDKKMVSLPVLRLRSSKGDSLTVLDDGDFPLVLHAESSYFSWRLDEIGRNGDK